MTGRSLVVWDENVIDYDFGPEHPMSPIRLQLTIMLARELGLLDGPGVLVQAPIEVPDAVLLAVHEAAYVAAVKLASAVPARADLTRGLGTDDVPAFPGMHAASLRIVGGTLAAAQAVSSGKALHAVNFAGGLHHAMAGNASGFCVYNDVAVAVAWLLTQGYERIAYVDVDVHHGDGVQAAFWNDPRVLTVSLHESGLALFPGTGFPDEIGGPDALGSAVNVALPPGTDDSGWLRAFDAIVPPALTAFAPQILVTQHGCDSHAHDRLADFALSLDGQRMAYEELHRLAHDLADGRWLATGGGGYQCVEVVPRAWCHLIGLVTGAPVDPNTPIPPVWSTAARELTGEAPPTTMTDGFAPRIRHFDAGYDPADPVDAAILATRKAVFPHLGLAH